MKLSADTFARALIASARSFKDCPIEALTATNGVLRRSILPAVFAITELTAIPQYKTCRAFNLGAKNPQRSRRMGGERFERAVQAAKDAIAADVRGAQAPVVPLPSSPTPARPVAEVVAQPNPKIEPICQPVPRPKPQPGEQYRTGRRARAIPKGASFKSLGEGVQVIRLKPIDDKVLDRARRTIGPRCTLETFADLWDVDAEALQRALQPEVTA